MSDATTTAEVNIITRGGPEAADNINRARVAVDNLASGGAELTNKFGSKLSSIGLTTLNYELLHSIEYTGKAKPVIGALNMAWTALAGGIGLSSSALFPWIAGIAAVTAIYAKIKPAHDNFTDSLKEADKVQVKVTDSYKDAQKWLSDYLKIYGTAPKAFTEYVTALKEIEKAEDNLSKKTLETQIDTLKKAIALENEATEKAKANTEARKNLLRVQEQNSAQTTTEIEDMTGLLVSQHLSNNAIKDNTERIKTAKEALEKYGLELKKAQAQLSAITGEYKKMGEAAKTTGEKESQSTKDAISGMNKRLKTMDEGYKKEDSLHTKLLNDKFAMEKAVANGIVTVNEVMYKTMDDFAATSYLSMTKGFGDSVSKMIMDGASFRKSIEEVFKNILSSFISMVAEMMLRWAAMKFITGPMGMGIPGFMNATGADYMVDRPTLFMAGENGAERVNVSPMGSNRLGDGQSGGSSNTTVTNHFTISGASDPQKIADIVSQKIIYSIRGRGQLNFVRG